VRPFPNIDVVTARRRRGDRFTSNDFLCLDSVAVELLVFLITRTKRSALDGDSGKQTGQSRVTKNLGSHPGVGVWPSGVCLAHGRADNTGSSQQMAALQNVPEWLLKLSFDNLGTCEGFPNQLGDGLANKRVLLLQPNPGLCQNVCLLTCMSVCSL